MRRVVCVALLLACASPAFAGDRMFSYDPVSADAKRLTGRGLTFIFDQGLLNTRAKRVLATAVPAQAELRPVGEGALGKGGRAALGEPVGGGLYEVDPKKTQGRVYIRAWCPGSTRLFMAIGRFGYSEPLTVTAIGDDPARTGATRICARMEFSWKGEWKLPGRGVPDPMEDTSSAGLENSGL